MMRYREKRRRPLASEAGITLVEMLVAMVVGLILAGGIYQIFVGSSESYRMNTQLARIQENGRFAMQILRQEIRGAGYLGCAQDAGQFFSTLNSGTTVQDFIYSYGNAIQGFESTKNDAYEWQNGTGTFGINELGAATGIAVANAAERPLMGSDIVIIRGVSNDSNLVLDERMPDTSAVLKIAGDEAALNKGGGDILLVTDCQGATLFQSSGYKFSTGEHHIEHNTGGSVSPGNSQKQLGHTYEEGAEIFFIRTVIYYLRNNPAGQPALYMKENFNDAVEIVDGVESMQVRYGEDTNGDGGVDVYVNANGVTNWANVRSVRIGLLLRSPAEIARGPVDNNAYDVSGDGADDFDPVGDRRMRLVMSGTIGLRNRLR